jgi:hypothetical protein
VPLSFVANQPTGNCWIIVVYCSSVQVARRSVRQGIVWGWEPWARVSVLLRLSFFGSPPPVFGAGGRLEFCRPLELLPMGYVGAFISYVHCVFLVICNLFGISVH